MSAQQYRDKYYGTDMADWDWDAIALEEHRARIRNAKLPRCSMCDQPLCLRQPAIHYSCRPEPSLDNYQGTTS